MRQVDPGVAALPQSRADAPEPPPPTIPAALVVADDACDRWMVLQQTGRGRRGHDVDRPKLLRQSSEQGGSKDHVAQEGGLNDEGGRSVSRSVGHLMMGSGCIAAVSAISTA